MSKHSKPIPNSGAAPAANTARNSGQTTRSPFFTKPERTADPKAPFREELKRVMPKDTDRAPAKPAAKEPLRAAEGDDDLMSQAPRKS
ncbi:hypothetical protein E8F12_15540 [Pseudomonas sp. BN102]|nr:hypothetical protein [Pseudomonas sp. BN102]